MITITWKLVRSFVLANWKPFAIVALLLCVYSYYEVRVFLAFKHGRESIIAEQKAEAARRDANANDADAASRKCSDDPSCLVRDDGHRRD